MTAITLNKRGDYDIPLSLAQHDANINIIETAVNDLYANLGSGGGTDAGVVTIQNVDGGIGVFDNTVDHISTFKSLIAGNNISISEENLLITIAVSGIYTKAEVDNLIPSYDLSAFYTKTEVDSNFYTQTQVDNLFNNLNFSIYYTKAEISAKLADYYTKTESVSVFLTINDFNSTLLNYYNKDDSDNRYYTQAYIDGNLASVSWIESNYYDKTYIDDNLNADAFLEPWVLDSGNLYSMESGNARIAFNQDNLRVSIQNSLGVDTIAMGYLSDIPKNGCGGPVIAIGINYVQITPRVELVANALIGLILKIISGTGAGEQYVIASNTEDAIYISADTWTTTPDTSSQVQVYYTSSEYGFYAKEGDKLQIDGDVTYDSGDFLVSNNGALKITSSLGQEVLRLGTYNGHTGLFLFDSNSQKMAEYSGSLIEIGDPDTGTGLRYQNGTLTIKGDLQISSGDSVAVENDIIANLETRGVYTATIDSNLIGQINGESVTDFLTSYNTLKNYVYNDLQNQVDGAIETWFYEYTPTLLNEPAVNWDSDTIKDLHKGDLFFDLDSGAAYRFIYNDTNLVYEWKEIPVSSDEIQGLATYISEVEGLADSKRKIFGSQPTVPYDVNDLWFNEDKIYRCTQSRTVDESYNLADWSLATKYTDDTVANNAISILDNITHTDYTKISGGIISTGKIESGDGTSYFDLDTGEIVMNGEAVIQTLPTTESLGVSAWEDILPSELTWVDLGISTTDVTEEDVLGTTEATKASNLRLGLTADGSYTIETTAGSQTKADSAQSSAISTAASDATNKANSAETNANSYTDTNAVLSDGTNAPSTITNSSISISADGTLNSAGGGQVTTAGIGAATPTDVSSAQTAAQNYADAQIALEQIRADAYADGVADAAELTAINAAQAKADAAETTAKAYADGIVTTSEQAAIDAANAYADAQDIVYETTVKAYADGIVSDEEARAIADATSKANAAQTTAISTAATDATTKANTAESNAISTAATDATTKATAAETNAKNYAYSEGIKAGNLINPVQDWQPGTTGTQGSFIRNGNPEESKIVIEQGPFGILEPVWQCIPDSTSDGDGGWNNNFNIDDSRTYVFGCYFWRLNSVGSLYLGCGTCYTLDNIVNSNPYFKNGGSLPVNKKWYLLIGVLHHKDYTGEYSGLAGVYDVESGAKIYSITEFKSIAGYTTQAHRAYHFYNSSGDGSTVYQKMVRPFVYEMSKCPPIDLLTDKAKTISAYADVTANNTANDTANVNGTAASTVKSNAEAGYQLTQDNSDYKIHPTSVLGVDVSNALVSGSSLNTKSGEWDLKETTEGAQAKATTAENNAKSEITNRGLKDTGIFSGKVKANNRVAEVGVFGLSISPSNGFLIKTGILYGNSRNMYTLQIRGGYDTSIDLTIKWYPYANSFVNLTYYNNGSYNPGTLRIGVYNGYTYFHMSNSSYYASMRMTLTSVMPGYTLDDADIQNWGLSDSNFLSGTEKIKTVTRVANMGESLSKNEITNRGLDSSGKFTGNINNTAASTIEEKANKVFTGTVPAPSGVALSFV